jgi:hypothetical protein
VISKIIEKLKTGTVKNVVPYGISKMPVVPYIVVKPESRSTGRAFRIITHFPANCIADLEDFNFIELPSLLDKFSAIDRHGCLNSLFQENDYRDIIVGNDDGSIAMEMVYIMPKISN